MPYLEGPFEFLECVNDNAHKIDLPGDYNVSATFNIWVDLSSYLDNIFQADLRTNLLQQGEDNRGPSPKILIDSSHKQWQVEV